MSVAPPMPLTRPRPSAGRATWPRDYLELTKPRIATMALVTVAAGYLLGAAGAFSWAVLLNTLLGAGLVAAGGSALNHAIERAADATMQRTARRPLPGGRVRPASAIAFGVLLAFGGVAYLALSVPRPGAALAAAATAALYVGIYTPLKRVTTWNTVVGAVPGALPPVIGWCAARDSMTLEALALFAILFVWQLPHFYSIAWMHRADYARGGMKMLPVVDSPDGRRTGRATVLTALLLIPVTALPFAAGAVGWAYLVLALPLAVWFWLRAVRFGRERTNANARTVLRGSLVYLLGVMALIAADGIAPLYIKLPF